MAANRVATGKYVGKSSAELAALKTQLETARTASLVGGTAYTRPGLSMTRVSYGDVTDELAEVEYALRIANGTLVTTTLADLSA